jgi:hypothetical protein
MNKTTNKMSKTKQQTQMVSKYLTQKQIDSFKVVNNGEELGKVILSQQTKNEEMFESTSGYDDFYFILKVKKSGELTITVGGIMGFSETNYNLMLDTTEGLSNDVVRLIKSNIKSMSKYLCHGTSVK